MSDKTPGKTILSIAVLGALCAAALLGCSRHEIPGVYKIDIQQGNVIDQDMLSQLEPGMDRRKVRFILGTPMLTDTFNDNRWDYYYSLREGHGNPVQRRISVYFEEDKLARIEGDIRPGGERKPVAPRKETIVTVPPDRSGEGLLSALKPTFLDRDEAPEKPEVPTADGPSGSEPAATGEPATGSTTQEAAASPALPAAPVPEPSAEDQAYLERLFEGFGQARRTSSGAPADAASAAGTPVVYEDDDLGIRATPGSAPAEESAGDEGGFIRRLIDRLRKNRDSDSTEQDETPPPAAPVPAQ